MSERKTFKPQSLFSNTKVLNSGLVLGTLNIYEAEMKRHNQTRKNQHRKKS